MQSAFVDKWRSRFLVMAALAAVTSSAGCAGTGPTWKEEVLMYDGTRVVVERQQILGNLLDQELSQAGHGRPVKGNVLRVPLRGNQWTAKWEAVGLNPLALGRQDGTFYLAAKPRLCGDYDNWGRPVPPYLFFRYDRTEWKRISMSEFPLEISKTNLSQGGGGASEEAIARGHINAEEVFLINGPLADYAKNIYRSGVRGVESCLEDFKFFDRHKGK